MTYREAIEIIEDCRYCKKKVGGECVGSDECFEAKCIALSALKEQEERNKGCEYCKGRAYTKKPVTITTIYGKKISIAIEFCPHCGRSMKGNENV